MRPQHPPRVADAPHASVAAGDPPRSNAASPSDPHVTTTPPGGTTGPPTRHGPATAARLSWLLLAVVILAGVILLSLAVGSKSLSPSTVIGALTHPDGSQASVIVGDLRLPRTIVGLQVGAALGVAGALMQALTRNPLADPGLLGVNAGAGFAVVLAVALLGITTIQGFVWFAFAGAVLAAVAVFAIGSAGRTGATPVRLTLAGVALSAVLTGISSGIALVDPAAFNRMRFWGAGPAAGAGSLAGRTTEMATTITPFIVVGLILAFAMARPLNAVALGDDLARSLGAHVGRTRIVVGIALTLLCGAATAAAGPIAFVGLMVPHVARWIVGPDQRWILPYSAVLAAILLLAADIIGRVIARPDEIQAGIVTAFVGAPVLIALVRRRGVRGV